MKPATDSKTALLLIDVQRGFDHASSWRGPRNNPAFEDNVAALLSAFRAKRDATGPTPTQPDIIHVFHHSTSPTSILYPGATFTDPGSGDPILGVNPQPYVAPRPQETTMVKHVNSAFIGTALEEYIRSNSIRQLVIVGLTTDHCVSTSTRMAANLKVLGDDGGVDGSGEGNGILLVEDATATHGKGDLTGDLIHKVNLASLDDEFCKVVTTKAVLEQVLV